MGIDKMYFLVGCQKEITLVSLTCGSLYHRSLKSVQAKKGRDFNKIGNHNLLTAHHFCQVYHQSQSFSPACVKIGGDFIRTKIPESQDH